MQWHSVAEFFAMGGYALYVWLSFGACLLVMVAEPLLVKRRHATAIADCRRKIATDRLDNEAL
jgi:heme exporter protein D